MQEPASPSRGGEDKPAGTTPNRNPRNTLNTALAVRMHRRAEAAKNAQAEKTWSGWWRHRARPAVEKNLEKPDANSWKGFLVHWGILGLIFTSTVCFCAETVPEYWKAYSKIWMWAEVTPQRHRGQQFLRGDVIGLELFCSWINIGNTFSSLILVNRKLFLSNYSQIFFATAFCLEYSLRLLVTSKPALEFITEPLNIFDLLSFLPTLIVLGLPAGATPSVLLSDLRILRVFRLTRVFKFGRYSEEMQYLVEGLMGARTSFVLLFSLLLLAMVFFSFLLFLLEQGELDTKKNCRARVDEPHYSGCSPYKDVPTGLYWAITTITTVG